MSQKNQEPATEMNKLLPHGITFGWGGGLKVQSLLFLWIDEKGIKGMDRGPALGLEGAGEAPTAPLLRVQPQEL